MGENEQKWPQNTLFGTRSWGGGEYTYFLGTARYSVGDPLATHACGLGLSPKYSLFMFSPALLATGWPFFLQKNVFFKGSERPKGVFGLKMLFLY